MRTLAALFSPWVWRMAWRDARATRLRLALYGLNLALGLAALTAVESFRHGAERAVELQARALIGADAVVSAGRPFTPEQRAAISALAAEQAGDISLASMLSAAGGTRLVNAHAIDPGFPFYGRLETDPPAAASLLHGGGGVVLEASVMRQLDLKPGDAVRLGRREFKVLGALRKAPGETLGMNTLAPRLYLTMADLPSTGLTEGASLARHRVLLRFAPARPASEWQAAGDELRRLGLSWDTSSRRARDLGGAMDRFSDFLSLISLAALALGGAGVAGAMRAHLQPRLPRVAMLRCLGCSGPAASAVYLVQAGAMAAVGSLVGIAAGGLLAGLMASAASRYLPLPLDAPFSPATVWRAAGLGLAVALWFCLPPLIEAGQTPPLAALRSAYEPRRRSRLAMVFSLLGGVGLILAAAPHGGGWRSWAGWSTALALVLSGLAGAGWTAALLMRKVAPRLPFAWRHGLANLHRPNRRTGVLVASLGLGAMVLVTLQNSRATLVSALAPELGADRPDAILFDIQPDQIGPLRTNLGEMGFPVVEADPVVTMRLAAVHGAKPEILAPVQPGAGQGDAPGGPGPEARDGREKRASPRAWALRREYRSTWRDHLGGTERVTAGVFTPRFEGEPSPTNRVPVAIEAGLAEGLDLRLADTLDFDVQGVIVPCRVGCLREVEWRQLRPNFFVVFPAGVLEQAPAAWMLATRTGGAEGAARMQREVFRGFPNVSVIDLGLVLATLDDILDKVSSAAAGLAGFCSLAGLLTLVSATAATQSARRREAAVWRALGASRRQLEWMAVAEHTGAGLCSAVAAVLLALPASWALAHWVFRAPLRLAPGGVGLTLLALPLLTVTAGWWGGRSAAATPPLAALRELE